MPSLSMSSSTRTSGFSHRSKAGSAPAARTSGSSASWSSNVTSASSAAYSAARATSTWSIVIWLLPRSPMSAVMGIGS